jgi:aspartyl-tRNA(Asn)/glutamyl-tRNA(Gln) amidotransferase subunit C
MQIDRQLILRLQELARLELSEEQQVRIQADLGNILNMIEQLQEVDTQGVEPLIYISEAYNVLRPDEISNQLERTKAMENAPLTDGTYFKVPKVIQIK